MIAAVLIGALIGQYIITVIVMATDSEETRHKNKVFKSKQALYIAFIPFGFLLNLVLYVIAYGSKLDRENKINEI